IPRRRSWRRAADGDRPRPAPGPRAVPARSAPPEAESLNHSTPPILATCCGRGPSAPRARTAGGPRPQRSARSREPESFHAADPGDVLRTGTVRAPGACHSMAEWLLILGQRLVHRFWRPDQREQAQEVAARQGHGRQPKTRDRAVAMQHLGQRPENGNPERRHVAAHIVAEAGAGRAEPRGKQLWKKNGIAAKRS